MRTPRLGLILLSLFCLLFACAPEVPAPGQLVQSSVQRITDAAPGADLSALVTNENDFAFSLYRQLASATEPNLVFSPTSITTALGMVSAGAAGTTDQAFTATLHSSLTDAAYHRAMNTLSAQLGSRGVGKQGTHGSPFKLTLLNQVFSQQGFTLGQPFLDTLAGEYGAGVRLLDFKTAAEAARVAINAWVKSGTEGLISELLQPGAVDSSTRLTLVNTVYFNAAWATPFQASATQPAAFATLTNGSKQVSTMHGSPMVGYAEVDGTTAVELPYDGQEVSMLLLLPAAGQLGQLESQLNAHTLASLVAVLTTQEVSLSLPRFSLDQRQALTAPLSTLGLGVAFGPSADFSGISTDEALLLQQVLHQAVVKTDEAGTVAAAATAVTVGTTSAPQRSVSFDRPFLFVIRDVATGSVLFVGRVGEP